MTLAVGVVRAVRRFRSDSVSRQVALQLVRAVTSAGANYEEARRAESRRDFIHKIALASKELDSRRLAREANELVSILVASGRTAARA
jgi:four helix bundle protein